MNKALYVISRTTVGFGIILTFLTLLILIPIGASQVLSFVSGISLKEAADIVINAAVIVIIILMCYITGLVVLDTR